MRLELEGVAGGGLVEWVTVLAVVEVEVVVSPVEVVVMVVPVVVGGAVVPADIPTMSPTALVNCCSEFLVFLFACILVFCCW